MKIQMQKLIALSLAFLLTLSFIGCSKKEERLSVIEDIGDFTSTVSTDEAEEPKSEDSKKEETSDVEETESVESEPPEPVHVGVEKITLSKYSVTLVEGSSEMPIVTMHPENATDKGEIWTSDNTDVATVDGMGNITGVSKGKCKVTVRSTDNSEVFAEVSVKVKPYVAPKKPKEPDVTYIQGILIANKTYPLPSTYNPGVDSTANSALNELFAAASEDGLNLFVASGFRSYSTQKQLYDNYAARDGAAEADRYSARPGHSEHQTGLAFDINMADSSFEGTPEAKWLAKNSHKYGFVIRYPQGKEHITGYIYEPWHIRYLGVKTATDVYNSGLCLEEYLGITSQYKN